MKTKTIFNSINITNKTSVKNNTSGFNNKQYSFNLIHKLSNIIDYIVNYPLQTITMGLLLQSSSTFASKAPVISSDVPICNDTIYTSLLSNFDTPDSALDLVVLDNIAYVADRFSGLQIINVTDPSIPTFLGSFNTPSQASGINVLDKIAYVADGNSGLQIIDITNSTNPTLLGSIDTPGFSINVVVLDNIAYIADQFSGLQIINVSDSMMPEILSSFDAVDEVRDLAVSNNMVYLADGDSGLKIVDVTNPRLPRLVSNFTSIKFAEGIIVSENIAYIADKLFGLQIINVSNPIIPNFLSNFSTPGLALRVVISDNHFVYIGDGSSGLQIINVSNSVSPVLLGNHFTGDIARGIAIVDNLAYIADESSGLQIIQTGYTPVLVQNQIDIFQGEILKLNSNDLLAIELNNDKNTLIFIISNIRNGLFKNVIRNTEINFFSQQQLTHSEIIFIHDGSTSPPSYLVSVSNGVVRTPPATVKVSFNLNSASYDKTNIIIGSIMGSTGILCYLSLGISSYFLYKKYNQKIKNFELHEVNLLEDQDNFHDTANQEESAKQVVGRYQVFDKMVPEHLQENYCSYTGFDNLKNLQPLGRGCFGETWVAYDEKSPKNSIYQFLAVKIVKDQLSFEEKRHEAETQKCINGVDICFEKKLKKTQLKMGCNKFYLIANKDKSYLLAYLDSKEEINHIEITEREFKDLYLRLKKLNTEGIDAIFNKRECMYEIEKENNTKLENSSLLKGFDEDKLMKKLEKSLSKFTYYAYNDNSDFGKWHLYYRHSNRKIDKKGIVTEPTLLEALNKNKNLNQSFQAYHRKQCHYEKNILLRLITNKISFESFINLKYNTMPVLDYFIQENNLYILSVLARYNGEIIKSLLSNSKLEFEKKLKILLLISNDLIIAVNYIHEKGFIHHDIKPDNIMFTNQGRALLIDFGQTVHYPEKIEPDNIKKLYVKGHPAYLSPEVFEINSKYNLLLNDKLNELSDIQNYFFDKDNWALGVTLLAFYQGRSNPFAVSPDQEDPMDTTEWKNACDSLKNNATIDYFEKRLEELDNTLQKNNISSIINYLLTVKLTKAGLRSLAKIETTLDKNYQSQVQEAGEMRSELFNNLLSLRTNKKTEDQSARQVISGVHDKKLIKFKEYNIDNDRYTFFEKQQSKEMDEKDYQQKNNNQNLQPKKSVYII